MRWLEAPRLAFVITKIPLQDFAPNSDTIHTFGNYYVGVPTKGKLIIEARKTENLLLQSPDFPVQKRPNLLARKIRMRLPVQYEHRKARINSPSVV